LIGNIVGKARRVQEKAINKVAYGSMRGQYDALLKHAKIIRTNLNAGKGLLYAGTLASGQIGFWQKFVSACQGTGDEKNAEGYQERVDFLMGLADECKRVYDGRPKVQPKEQVLNELNEYIEILEKERGFLV